ncbi:hypothetical protein ACHWQZ_G005815 [Mnemiopsis leidyi]
MMSETLSSLLDLQDAATDKERKIFGTAAMSLLLVLFLTGESEINRLILAAAMVTLFILYVAGPHVKRLMGSSAALFSALALYYAAPLPTGMKILLPFTIVGILVIYFVVCQFFSQFREIIFLAAAILFVFAILYTIPESLAKFLIFAAGGTYVKAQDVAGTLTKMILLTIILLTGATADNKDDATEVRTSVALDVYTITTSGNRSVTTGKDQIISCSISGLGSAANVRWIDPDNFDIPTNDTTNYVVDDGKSTYSEGNQTTKLTIKTTRLAILNYAGTYKCSVTSTLYAGSPSSQKTVTVTPIDDATEVRTSVALDVYTITTSGDRSVTSGKDQIISCSISGLGSAANVRWIDPDNDDIPTNDTTNYVVDDGKSTYYGGNQTTKLTIKTTKLAILNYTAGTYKCSVTSTLYAGSPSSQKTVTVTPIAITTSGDRSVTTGKDQIISCSISGLGSAANVRWIDPDNDDIPTNDTTNYVVDDGKSTYSEENQTTKLTIKTTRLATLNYAGTYKCSVTSTLYADSPPSQKTVTVTPIVN